MKRLLQILKFSLSSFIAWLLEFLLYDILILIWVDDAAVRALYYVARIIILIPNFIINRQMVFSKNASVGKAAVKFVFLQLLMMIVAAESTHLLSNLVDIGEVLTPIVVRVPVDLTLFVLSYFVQKLWIFKDKQ
ncbi:MAG: GtrA family protein [Clostridia bacterium]|nr:GtrA family protein [Clostridia bacterium]